MTMTPFSPGATTSLAVSTVSSRVALGSNGSTLEVQNAGTTTIFVKLGTSSVDAAVTDYPIQSGQSKVISRDRNNQSHIAAVTASGSGTLYVTAGEGV